MVDHPELSVPNPSHEQCGYWLADELQAMGGVGWSEGRGLTCFGQYHQLYRQIWESVTPVSSIDLVFLCATGGVE